MQEHSFCFLNSKSQRITTPKEQCNQNAKDAELKTQRVCFKTSSEQYYLHANPSHLSEWYTIPYLEQTTNPQKHYLYPISPAMCSFTMVSFTGACATDTAATFLFWGVVAMKTQ